MHRDMCGEGATAPELAVVVGNGGTCGDDDTVESCKGTGTPTRSMKKIEYSKLGKDGGLPAAGPVVVVSSGHTVADSAVWTSAGLALLVGCGFLSAVIYSRAIDTSPPSAGAKDVTKPTGWLGAVGAIVTFGSQQLPVRLSSLEGVEAEARSGLFTVFGALGNGVATILVCTVLRISGLMSGSFSPLQAGYGAIGAADICLILSLAFSACQVFGIAAAPAIWCGIGMFTSFVWGTLAFHEPIHSTLGALSALGLLACGVATVASAQADFAPRLVRSLSRRCCRSRNGRDDDRNAIEGCVHIDTISRNEQTIACEGSEDPVDLVLLAEQAGSLPRQALFQGLCLTASVGLLDGSLMAPYKLFVLGTTSGGIGSVVPSIRTLTYAYLEGFGVGILVLFPLLLACQAILWWRRQRNLQGFMKSAKLCVLPGMLSGMMWAVGNTCSVHASEYLGVALGFPLTQSCIVINAFWGVYLFGEMPGMVRRGLCTVGIFAILAGAVVLSHYGGS